ncbi:MAG TPA: aspartyl protease family protein, partial [Kofleriaceae bacterium]|nr:aspartyl protease family protein [Kofleriaceae bacterium]
MDGFVVGCCMVVAGCGASALEAHDTRIARVADTRLAVTLRPCKDMMRVLASGRLGDVSGSWVVDTGSSDHTLPEGASSARFEGTSTAPRCADNQDLIVSPQRLAPPGGGIELDLRHGALFRIGRDAIAGARDEVAGVGVRLGICRDSRGYVATVPAIVDGREVALIVDTGSPITALFADTTAGMTATLRATDHIYIERSFPDGSAASLALVPSAHLEVGDTTETLAIVVMAHPPIVDALSCHADGLLGLDVLRGCTIVLDATGGALACEVPPPGVDTAPGLERLPREPHTAGLLARAPAPAPGVATTGGCDAVTEAEVSAWAAEHHVPT